MKKAIGMYIFGGSQTIGHMLEGWDINTVLEMTDTMTENNSYHFTKNYPNIDIKLPKDYEDDKEYIQSLKDESYDLLFANPPCSGLSQINRHASVDNKVNGHLYKVMEMINNITPKTFLIENAPTLTTTGFPILKDMTKKLGDKYYILIINDLAANHNVSMHRRRTFVVGFNKDHFKGIPIIDKGQSKELTSKEVLDAIKYEHNLEFEKGTDETLFKYYNMIDPRSSLYRSLAVKIDDVEELPAKLINPIKSLKRKLETDGNIWDKSPWRVDLEDKFPSMTSLTKIVHPTEDRDLYIREYAAIMGYPDDFVFYPNECKTPTVQCIAQGVPVNFIRYISKEIMKSFDTTEYYDGSIVYINQTSKDSIKMSNYNNIDDFCNASSIHTNEQLIKL